MIFKLLLVYLVTLPLMKTPNLPFLAQRIQFSEVVFLFLFFFWISRLLKNKKLPHDPGLNKQFLLFSFFCALSFYSSSNLFKSVIELLGLIYLYLMLILVVDIVGNKRKLDTIIKVWIGALVVVLVLGFVGLCISLITGRSNLFCQVHAGNFPYLNTAYRMMSTFRHPASLTNFLIVSLGFVVSDLLSTENKRYRTFLKFLIFFISLAVIVTITKSILGFVVTAFLLFSYFHKTKGAQFRIVIFLFVISIIVIFLFITIFCSTFYIRSFKIENFSKGTHRELAFNVEYAYQGQFAVRMAALEMLRRHPFFGVGLAMFPSYCQRLNKENYFKDIVPIYGYLYGNQYLYDLPIIDPHNDFLQYLAETGIFGGGTFILFIGTFLYIIIITLKKIGPKNSYVKVRLFCFLSSFIGILADSMEIDVFKVRHIWFLMALTLALIMMHKNKIDNKDSRF